MFFAGSGDAWQALVQTHPSLEERIRRFDPAIAAVTSILHVLLESSCCKSRSPDAPLLCGLAQIANITIVY
jgi:hypothetical protein